MRQRRARYRANRTRLNGVDISEQDLVFLGYCNSKKEKVTKSKATNVLLRFEDKKWVKDNKLDFFYEWDVSLDSFGKFFTKVATPNE